jgi:hypothetical protein
MAFLADIQAGALMGATADEKLDSIIKQLNDWARAISNEGLTTVYKDNSGTNRIIIGVLPDGDTGIVISKDGVEVQEVFS